MTLSFFSGLQIHVITSLSRFQNFDLLASQLRTKNVTWHVITDQGSPIQFVGTESWIRHYSCPNTSTGSSWERCNFAINWFLENAKIADMDFYCILHDDDAVDPSFFVKVRKALVEDPYQRKVVITSVDRGYQIPVTDSIDQPHPIGIVEAKLENINAANTYLEQLIVQGVILKKYRLRSEKNSAWQFIQEITQEYTPIYLPQAMVWFNYFEPNRWKKMESAHPTNEHKHLVFFNYWHYGDLFTTRGLVRDIMNQLPGWHFAYAHQLHENTVKDMMPSLNKELVNQVKTVADSYTRLAVNGGNYFVNTWIGSYKDLFPNNHPSYVVHHKIIEECYKEIENKFGFRLKLNPDYWHYVPDIDYSYYNTSVANRFLSEQRGRTFLICNTLASSMQTSMGDMKEITETLADRYPNDTFLATHNFRTTKKNIKFTGPHVFKQSCDLGEISYLSTKINLIVGKNSGPFTYSTTKRNLLDRSKIFLCFSHKEEDTLPYGLNINASYRFSDATDHDTAVALIEQAIQDIKS